MENKAEPLDLKPDAPPDYSCHLNSSDPNPDAPPEYNSHSVAGPPGPAVPPPSGYPGGLPTGGAYPIQYQPGRYPSPNRSAPTTWMPMPAPVPNCPSGLEYLGQLDSIHVLQRFEPLKTGFETNYRYHAKNNLDRIVYTVTEDTADFIQNAETLRPFILWATDSVGREVMIMQRPFRCTNFCCPCPGQELEVQCPSGITIGFVVKHWNLCRVVYSIQNEEKENVMRVHGPCSTYGCGSDSVFEVKSLDGGSSISSITQKWNGVLSAMSDADHFEIHFPLDLDVTMKAIIFGACFLIESPREDTGRTQPFARQKESSHQKPTLTAP
ncbi:phospholipid scramblase 4-like [Hippopotamus amphibius kiboko]|uniref:phospholipid scramblase 4-like n=1 Tax=Hippopotamus amphibius kiboko TaxID=575201 RepID=UPI002592A1F9|nr:phospholipid scramblase 4-like [Hippopotamus amphibius kiboko]